DARTDKCVAAMDVQHKDHIWETINQAARKFLLLVQIALDLAARSYIHQRALVTHNFPRVVPNRGSSVEAYNWFPVFANQDDLAPLDNRLTIHLCADALAKLLIREDL